MSLEADGVRGLVAGLTVAGLLTGVTTASLRGWGAALAGPAAGVSAALGLSAWWQAGAPALPVAGFAGCAAATVAWWTARARERRRPPGWSAGTWLLLHLLATAGAWLACARAQALGVQLALGLLVALAGVVGALSLQGVTVVAGDRPSAPWAERLASLPAAIGVAAVALWLATRAPGAVWGSLLPMLAACGLAGLAWSGRLTGGLLIALPAWVAGAAAAPAGDGWALVACGLGAALGLREAAGRLAVRQGREVDPPSGETLLGGGLLAAGAASLGLAEAPWAHQAAGPLLTAMLAATAAALAWTGAGLRHLARPPRANDGLATRYRWLGAWTSLHAAWCARHDPLLRALPDLVGDARQVLVAGSGCGFAVTRLASRVPVMIRAVELDPERLAVGLAALTPEERARVIPVAGDLRRVDLGTADLVILLDVLQSWSPLDQRELLARLAETLPPGGELLFRGSCPGPDTEHVALEWGAKAAWWLRLDRGGRGPRFATATDYGRLLNEARLAVTKAYPEHSSAARLVLRCKKV